VARLKRSAGKAAAGRSPGGRAGGKAAGRKLAGRGGGGTLRAMGSLLKAAVLVGAVAALVFLLPLGGRTLADRWRTAGSASVFGARLWAELRGEPAASRKHPGRKGGAGSGDRTAAGRTDADQPDDLRADEPRTDDPRTDAGRPAEGRTGSGPTERHTDAERQALDRLLGDHLGDPPKR
jgi:hypothetical protein